MKPILLGEAVGPGTDEAYPLSGPSGQRLQAIAGFRDYHHMCWFFEPRNLLIRDQLGDRPRRGDSFPIREARAAMEAFMPQARGRVVVLLGARLGRLFGVGPHQWVRRDGVLFTAIPHPSGLNLLYNDPAQRQLARDTLQRALTESDRLDS